MAKYANGVSEQKGLGIRFQAIVPLQMVSGTGVGDAGANAYAGALIRTAGPAFYAVPFNPNAVTRTETGTATITFANGNAGSFAYEVNDRTTFVRQTKAITRQVFREPGTMCQ